MCPICYYHEIAGLIQPKLSMFSTCNHWFQAPLPPVASASSSQLISYAQDVDYTRMEGFKQFKSHYNIKNAWATHNNPNGVYLTAEHVYQAVKGLGCTLRSFNGLSLDDFCHCYDFLVHLWKRLNFFQTF